MSVGACACTAIRVLFLYWATHNVLSSILPFIMNAASPFKCSHKHTADKNLIKCRLKPNRKTHWLIIFYHVPWSYFFSSPLILSTCSSLGYIFSACQKWQNTSHISPWRREIVQNAKRGAVTRLIRILVSGEDGGWRRMEGEGGGMYRGCKEGISCFIPNLHHIPKDNPSTVGKGKHISLSAGTIKYFLQC